MKTLYFDIDGTILLEDRNAVKPRLGAGEFESAVRSAAFSKLVCVGNFCAVARAVRELRAEYDALGVVFHLCRGAFRDEAWFRSSTVLIEDPQRRVDAIDLAGDWWYLDDSARLYMADAGKIDVFREDVGRRICAPDPVGDGADVLGWLKTAAR
jgi:hypothetical protein